MTNVVPFPENNQPLSAKLQVILDGEYAEARAKARALISTPEFAPVSPDLPKEEYREKTMEWVRKMVDAGFTKLPYDKKYGGDDANTTYLTMAEIIAHQDMSLAIKQGVQFGLFGLGMYMLGTEKHHARYLPDIMSGKLLGGFAMTEIGGGSDVQGVQTEAIYDAATRSFTLNTPNESARKAYIGNAAVHGRMMVVFAQLKMDKDAESQGVHAFMVPVRGEDGRMCPGIEIEDCGPKVGLNGVDNGYITFKNVYIPYDRMLDRFAQITPEGAYKSDTPKKTARFFKMISTLVTGRVFVSMASVSGAKNALAASINFAKDRKVFGDILLDKQATHARLFPALAKTYALHFATRQLLDKYKKGTPDLETMAAAIKAVASDDGVRIADEGRIATGGAGYMSKERFGALRNDMDVFRTFEGDNTVLRFLVAKNRLGELKASFNGAHGFKKTLKMVSMAFNDKMDKLQAHKSSTSLSHLLDADFHVDIFAKRERAMMHDLAQKFGKIAKSQDAAAAVNACQLDMIAYSDAYAEKVLMEEFARTVSSQQDPQVKAALKDLCDLYAVSTLRQNALWYVENGFMSTGKTQALVSAEQHLYDKVRPNAVSFVDAFAIPDSILSIAKKADPAPSTKKPGIAI